MKAQWCNMQNLQISRLSLLTNQQRLKLDQGYSLSHVVQFNKQAYLSLNTWSYCEAEYKRPDRQLFSGRAIDACPCPIPLMINMSWKLKHVINRLGMSTAVDSLKQVIRQQNATQTIMVSICEDSRAGSRRFHLQSLQHKPAKSAAKRCNTTFTLLPGNRKSAASRSRTPRRVRYFATMSSWHSPANSSEVACNL